MNTKLKIIDTTNKIANNISIIYLFNSVNNVSANSTDNCAVASISVSPSSFTCANVGANTVTLTVTDVYGNSSTCTATPMVSNSGLRMYSSVVILDRENKRL